MATPMRLGSVLRRETSRSLGPGDAHGLRGLRHGHPEATRAGRGPKLQKPEEAWHGVRGKLGRAR